MLLLEERRERVAEILVEMEWIGWNADFLSCLMRSYTDSDAESSGYIYVACETGLDCVCIQLIKINEEGWIVGWFFW